ncbi:MAG: TerC/Alx family metal homeostasis membrane protein [Mailhella sp.]|nr:TerC/Alx family metal homeostasis membrane protein [Mailhella sp.]
MEIIIFVAIVTACMWLDLHAHSKDKPVSARDAALWTAAWVVLAFAFAAYIGWNEGADKAQLFIAGYLLEESLSVDNLFVMMAIFGSFAIRDKFQHRVLYYGILGAVVMRLLFVAAGSSIIALFGPYALAGFGIFVLWTAWKMFRSMGHEQEEEIDYAHHWAVRWTQKIVPVHAQLHGHDFFVLGEHKGKKTWKATPLFLCLIVIEISDIMFAFDSVPAVIAITSDPFLVYTSNIFAILGLRSMFFLLSAAKRYLRHLEKAVIAILAFIGAKMLLDVSGFIHVPASVSLAVVALLLLTGILASLLPDK